MFFFNDIWYINKHGKLEPTKPAVKLRHNIEPSETLGFDYLLNQKGIYTEQERQNAAHRYAQNQCLLVLQGRSIAKNLSKVECFVFLKRVLEVANF